MNARSISSAVVAYERLHIGPDRLIILAERGQSMTAQRMAVLLAALGVVPMP